MKEILIPLNFTTTPTVYDTKQSFSTSDEASGVLTFTTTADVSGTVASLTIRNASENANRQTILIERLDVNTSPFSYKFRNPLPFGQYEGTVLLKKNLTVIASASFLFGVNSSLSAEVLPDLVKAYALDELVENVETEVSNLKDAYNLTVSETVKGVNKTESNLQAQENVRYLNEHQRKANELERIANENARIAAELERKDTFDTLVDSEVIEQTVAQEVTNEFQQIEATYANRLLSTEQQLAANTTTLQGIDRTFADTTYATLAALQAAYPAGDTKRYLVAADGKWYWWSGSAWTAGQVAQAVGIADNSIDADKKTDNAQFGLLAYTSKPIDFDFISNTITIYKTTVLIFKKARYVIANDVDLIIDISSITSTLMYGLFYNKTTNAFKVVATGNMANVTEDDILLAAFNKTTKLINIPASYTLNGTIPIADNGILSAKRTDNGNSCIFVSDNSYPNFDFINNKIIFYPNTILIFKTSRYVIATGSNLEIDISTVSPTTSQVGVFYNRTSNVFTLLTASQMAVAGTIKEDMILVASFQKTKKLVFMAGGHKINGVDYGITIPSNASRFLNKKANFLGDSFTWGYSPYDGTQLANPFPKLVGQTLGLATVNNYGLSGSTIADLGSGANNPFCTRYTAMDSTADINFILGGTNDWTKNTPLGTITDTTNATFYGALNTLITGMLTKYPTQTIVLATPMHRKDDTVPNSLGLILEDLCDAIKAIGKKYGIFVLDLYETSGFYPDNETNYTSICPDGRHPNDAGHIKLANRISGALMTV